MIQLELIRVSFSSIGEFGVLLKDGAPICLTFELPWKGNEPQVSCIPTGKYVCKRVQSAHYGETFEVSEVPNRSLIRIHPGNTTADSRGCILVGDEFFQNGVLESREAFARFMKAMGGVNEFELFIRHV